MSGGAGIGVKILRQLLLSGPVIRQQIVDALDLRFKSILIVGGYQTDIGKNVFAWRSTAFTDDELPGLAYLDLDESNDVSIGEWEHGMILEIDLHILHETDAMRELRNAITDVLRAIGLDTRLGGLTEDITPSQRDFIKITQNDERYASCMLNMIVTYLTNRWQLTA